VAPAIIIAAVPIVPLLLDLLRHGVAEPQHPLGDDHRALTDQGARAIESLAHRLAATSARPDRVFSSPLARARQTAAIVSRAWVVPPPIEELAELEPESDPADVLEALRARNIDSGHVLLVAHQPLLGRLAVRLTGGESRFAPGTLIRVECENGSRRPDGRVVFSLQAHDD
jgi:phosphohistidine phosphatase